MEGNVSVYQVNPVRRISGKGGAESELKDVVSVLSTYVCTQNVITTTTTNQQNAQPARRKCVHANSSSYVSGHPVQVVALEAAERFMARWHA